MTNKNLTIKIRLWFGMHEIVTFMSLPILFQTNFKIIYPSESMTLKYIWYISKLVQNIGNMCALNNFLA